MNFRDLEHEGDESFDQFSVRQSVKDEKKKRHIEKKLTEPERLDEEQKEWLSVENPLLWEGEFD